MTSPTPNRLQELLGKLLTYDDIGVAGRPTVTLFADTAAEIHASIEAQSAALAHCREAFHAIAFPVPEYSNHPQAMHPVVKHSNEAIRISKAALQHLSSLGL